jgi:ectoine hydroxylase-related dioxygenase (phytanoyl-CoA dioxygenase family)
MRLHEDTSTSVKLYRDLGAREREDGATTSLGEEMKSFQEFGAGELTSHSLQNEMNARGYVLVRELVPQDALMHLLREIMQVLCDAGWILRGHHLLERMANLEAACGDPDPAFKSTYQRIFNLEAFHALPHHPALQKVMKMLVGERLLIHPKPIGRLIFPHCERLTVHAHQDYRFMGGDPECFTAWIPLHDCPVEIGPLQIMEGSHRLGYQWHKEENLHVPEIPQEGVKKGEWVRGQINAGDVLLFHSLTVHAASPNLSQQLRISLDCRFQDYRRVLNPANLAFAGESGKSWEKTYAGWRSDDLKYYWKKLPLALQPSKSELEYLAMTAEPSSARARYARILSQLS